MEEKLDQIIIEELEVYAYHGVFSEENAKGQAFYVNAILNTKTRKAGQLDDLELSTNYGDVCQFIHSYMTNRVCKLLEAVAEGLAESILLHFTNIDSLTLEIRKPHAPIGLPFSSVSVKIERGWHRAYIAFGSNMGNRDAYIENALIKIKKHPLCKMKAISTILRTTPYGGQAEGEFLNGVFAMDTLFTPEELLGVLREMETDAGRERIVRWGSRTLDLDILFFDDYIISNEELTIPHIDMANRDFVLEPLCEIAPYFRHPITKQTITQMLMALKQTEEHHVIRENK